MLVQLRVSAMFVLAFVLVVLISDANIIDSGGSGDALHTKASRVRSDHMNMVFEDVAKANDSGTLKQLGSPRRDILNEPRAVSRKDSKTDNFMQGFGLRTGLKLETDRGLGPFTSISYDSLNKTATRTGIDSEILGARPAIVMSSVAEYDSADTDVYVVYGPVQGAEGALLNVLGQQFDLSGMGISQLDLSAMVGRSAYVEAQQTEEGLKVTRIEIFDEYSVPGASPVLVVGNVTQVDAEIGRLQIGNLEVDTSIMGTEISFESGEQVFISGTQPVPGGLILSEQNLIVDANLIGALGSSKVVSISGSSARGISGSSARGISGSSARGISGSSARGISGSSAR